MDFIDRIEVNHDDLKNDHTFYGSVCKNKLQDQEAVILALAPVMITMI